MFLGKWPSQFRYEASATDADDVCFTFWRKMRPSENFQVDYNITSDTILVYMNLRSAIDNRIIRSRLLPSRFKQFYEYCENLIELYKIEFCASTEKMGDANDASTSSATIDHVYHVPNIGLYSVM